MGSVVSTVEQFAAAYKAGTPRRVSGLVGRILRGKTSTDFEYLSDDPNRKIVFLIGSDGLQEIVGKSGYDALLTVGYTPEYIRRLTDEGTRFRLVVLPEGGTVVPATWEDTIRTLATAYPVIASDLYVQLDDLKVTSLLEIEHIAGCRFADLVSSDDLYMTYDKYLVSPRDLVATRAFLYFSVCLRELYSGDGYTYTVDGVRGVSEYIVLNRALEGSGEYVVLLVDVSVENK